LALLRVATDALVLRAVLVLIHREHDSGDETHGGTDAVAEGIVACPRTATSRTDGSDPATAVGSLL
jgi:hypothetical protein